MSASSSRPPSPTVASNALIALPPPPWRPILQAVSQVVLYNPHSHALSISTLPRPKYDDVRLPSLCPYCHQPIPEELESPDSTRRAPNYFHLLALSNETFSRPSTPPAETRAFAGETMAEGYYETFFREERRLGMGANGSVFLCQHVLDGNPLGHFAVKKIAVGASHTYLLKMLREVRLLETLRHPNIVTYHHAWLESSQFSPFGERVPTLHVLMQYAEGGSLDSLLAGRQGVNNMSPSPSSSAAEDSRSARIRSLRANKLREAERGKTAVHLLAPEEIAKLFEDVVSGLTFLHERSILHLDLKPANVLLVSEDGSTIPRALLSDFGASQDMLHVNKERSGETGTLEYMAPEIISPPLIPVTKAADLWSLGMILHALIFFRLPYSQTKDVDKLEVEVMTYSGFSATGEIREACARRGLPPYMLKLLEGLLSRKPAARPSAERILSAINAGKLKATLSPSSAEESAVVARFSPHAQLSEPTWSVDDMNGHMKGHSGIMSGVEGSVASEEDGSAAISVRPSSQSPSTPSMRTRQLIMMIKAGTLVAKIVSFPALCPGVRLNSWRGVLVVGLAATDLLTENVMMSGMLAGVHACLVAVWCAS